MAFKDRPLNIQWVDSCTHHCVQVLVVHVTAVLFFPHVVHVKSAVDNKAGISFDDSCWLNEVEVQVMQVHLKQRVGLNPSLALRLRRSSKRKNLKSKVLEPSKRQRVSK
eukprot:3689063-Amphidinium_carterae.1